jgi:hypothetical protein
VARKIQVPSVGGLRKVIAGTAASTATTISGLEGQSITLQQLALALGTVPVVSSGTSAPAAGGGGSLANPVVKIPPFPFIINEEGGDDGYIIPGPAGRNGIIGSNGSPGTTVVLTPDEYDDPVIIPGSRGPSGTNGTSGSPGLTVVLTPDEYDDPVIIPGTRGAAGTNGANGLPGLTVFVVPDETDDPLIVPGISAPITGGVAELFNVTPDTHGAGVPAFLANDEFEGASLDVGGTRFAGATSWAWVNQVSATASLNNGACAFVSELNGTLLGGTGLKCPRW